MSTYSIRKGKNIDSQISNYLKAIKKIIFSNIKKSQIYSLLLVGGFGRGEGSILIGSKIEPINDFDLLLITQYRISNGLKFRLQKELTLYAKKINIEFIDLDYCQLNQLNRFNLPTISNYELIKGYKVLYGNEPRFTEIYLKDIPYMEFSRLMLNRIGGLLMAKYVINSRQNSEARNRFIYTQISKAILAIGDSYLFLNNKYDTSYSKRLENIKSIHSIDKTIVTNYILASTFKLKPTKQKYSINLLKSFNTTIKFIEQEFLNLESIANVKKYNNYQDWSIDYINRLITNQSKVQSVKNFFSSLNSHYFKIWDYKLMFVNRSDRRRISGPFLLFNIDINFAKKLLNIKKNNLINSYFEHWHELPNF